MPTASQWRNEVIDLSSLNGLTSVDFIFENAAGFGNTVYLDNINIIDSAFVGVNELEMNNITVYPNPATNMLTVAGLSTDNDMSMLITDLAGKEVLYPKFNSNSQQQINISSLAKGIYFLQINTTKANKIIKFIKE